MNERASQHHEDHEHDQSAYEVIGIQEVLAHQDILPTVEFTDPEPNFEEEAPLLTILYRRIGLLHLEVTRRIPLSVETRRKNKVIQFFKIRIPLTSIQIPQYAHLEGVKWVDVDITALKMLYQKREYNHRNLSNIIAAIQNLETAHNLLVRGDGVIGKPK